jgi:hypothetical protein
MALFVFGIYFELKVIDATMKGMSCAAIGVSNRLPAVARHRFHDSIDRVSDRGVEWDA